MPKKTASTFKKSFNIDLDSLLMTDFIEEKEKITEPSSPEHWNPLKKFKTDTTKLQTEMKPNAEENVGNTYEKSSKTSQDVSKFFENFGNDFNKSMQVKKGRLTQFTKMVASTYQTKVSEMMKKQEAEVDLLKKEAIKNIMGNFEQFEKEFQKLIQQENKLTKFLEQHIKMIAKSSAIQEQWIEDLTQAFGELRTKQKNETLELTKSLGEEIANLQSSFLREFTNEELQTMKKYLNCFYF